MPIAHTYDGATDPRLNIFMKTAVVNGLSGLQSLNTVSASCDTGNCSFPAYNGVTHSTVRIESMCFDISPFLEQENRSTSNSYTSYWWSNYSLSVLNAGLFDPSPDYREMRQYLAHNFLAEDEPLPWEDAPSKGLVLGWNPLFNITTSFLILTHSLSYTKWNSHRRQGTLLEWSIGSVLLVISTFSPCQTRSVYADYLTNASLYPWGPTEFPMVSTSSCPQLGMQDVQTFQ